MDEIQKVEKLKEHMAIIEEDIKHCEVIQLLFLLYILHNVLIGKMVEVITGCT